MKPKLSVIIPVYNAEKRLDACIQSILKQSFSDMEIILVDDGSGDNSLKICNEYANKDKRIVVLHQSNKGVSAARNNGIMQAKGEYIAFVDSDDIIDNDTYKWAIQYLEENQLDMVSFGMFFDFFKNGLLTKRKEETIYEDLVLNNKEIGEYFLYLYGNNYLSSACNKVYKRSIMKEYNVLFNTNMAIYEDLAFVLDFLYRCQRFGALKIPLYHYYHNVSISQIRKRPNINYIENFRILSEKMVNLTSHLGLNDPSDIRRISGFIFRFYLIGIEKLIASDIPFYRKYYELKKYYRYSGMKSAVMQAKCSGYKLNIVLYMFKKQLLLGVFITLYLYDLYLIMKCFWHDRSAAIGKNFTST